MMPSAERADARANRARLIEAAHAVFRELGPDAEMKVIAERAGLGVGTIYRNFPTKEDLITAIIGGAIERIGERLTLAAEIADPIAAVRSVLSGGFAILDEYGDLMAALLSGHMPAACKAQFAKQDEIELLAGIIRRGVESGVFRAGLDSLVTAALINGTFVPWNYHQLRATHSAEQVIERFLDVILHGVLAAADTSGRQ